MRSESDIYILIFLYSFVGSDEQRVHFHTPGIKTWHFFVGLLDETAGELRNRL